MHDYQKMPETKKILSILSLIFLMLSSGIAQDTDFGQNTRQTEQETEQTEVQSIKKVHTPDVSVSLGTSFTSFAPGYNSFGTFIAPEFLFPVSNRFAISAGIGYSSIFHNSPGISMMNNQPMQYGSVYVSGSYRMTEKLTISGTGYKTFLLNPPDPANENSPDYFDNSNQGFILNMNYKVSDNFRINASFQFHQQNGSPYNYMYPGSNISPHFNGGFSPFYNQGYHPGF